MDIDFFLSKMPDDFLNERNKLFSIAKDLGFSSAQIEEFDSVSIENSCKTSNTYDVCFWECIKKTIL